LGRPLPPDPDDLRGAEDQKQPRRQGAEEEGRGRSRVPEHVVEPGEDAEPGCCGDRGGQPVPASRGSEVGDDERQPDRARRVPEGPGGGRRAGAPAKPTPRPGPGAGPRRTSAPAATTTSVYAPASAGRYACWPWAAKWVPTAARAASPAASVMSAMRSSLVAA